MLTLCLMRSLMNVEMHGTGGGLQTTYQSHSPMRAYKKIFLIKKKGTRKKITKKRPIYTLFFFFLDTVSTMI